MRCTTAIADGYRRLIPVAVISLLGPAAVGRAGSPLPARPQEARVAARVDAALRRAVPAGVALPEVADDATFLRRACLGLTGRLPTPEQMSGFTADGPGKCRRLVERLLDSEAYAVNWGRYWRDAVTYHTPASGNYLRWQLFDRWWAEQFRRNRPWDQVVTALVTATGVNDEVAPVNYLTALYGNPVEIAATTSRVFLGVQIQCAQCHDAKTETWRREQFHEFAAFFGRARIVQHKDVTGRGTPYAIEGRADGQYLMTAKADPSRLIPMRPRFLTGEAVSLDADDDERRQALARLLTSPANPWFARCFVNRLWTALLGWGFYPGVADLGRPQPPRYPEALDLLARAWVESGYDVKWLFRTVALTDTYRRSWRPAGPGPPAVPAVCPCPLRPEQVFEAMQQALAFKETDATIPAPAPRSAPAVQRHEGLRNMVYQAFKADPSLPGGEVRGTIPQALLMLNSALVHKATSAQGRTVLADLLGRGLDDEAIVTALYERVLARRPTPRERDACLRHVRRSGKRAEGLEDVLWCLVNSTEFLHKK
jgi:hypothetical protein